MSIKSGKSSSASSANNSQSAEYAEILELNSILKNLLSADHYIAKSEYSNIKLNYQKCVDYFSVLKKSDMLNKYCRQNHLSSDTVDYVLSIYENIDDQLNNKNDEYIAKELVRNKKYLDNILHDCDPNILLDEDQRKVILSDEDYTLVIAGAGAGKTTTVAAKVKYLVEKQNIDPKKILVISFTNKAVNELKQRIIGQLHIECPIATFHSTGNAILHKHIPENLKIVESSTLYYVILEYLKSSALQNPATVDNLIMFFSTYFDIPYEGADLKDFFNNIAKSTYTTMRSELDEYERIIIDNRTKKKVTILSEQLRSSQEVEIANFLYLNGIDYEYEPLYPYNIYYSRKPYTPDFIITQGDKTAYIEHFGISENGKNSIYTNEELEKYKKSVNDKILLHRQHGTKLIYTYSSYKDGRTLLDHLQEALEKNGFVLNRRSNKEILEKIVSSEENKYLRKLVNLIQRFISNFKVNGFNEDEFNRMYHQTRNVRTRLFLNICNECYLEYERYLKDTGSVDFEDMINESARLLKEVKEMKQKLDFDYIIVDEYQDISRQRFDLVSALHEVTDAKIIAVGDDWQSIYAFSGSDITLFTKFAEKMGYAKLLKIVRTYRNSQEVIDIAGNFIQKNKEQIQKELISPKNIQDPVIIYTYSSKRKDQKADNKSGANYALAHAVETAIEQILQFNKTEGKPDESSILLLGRYGFDGDKLQNSGLFEYIGYRNKVKSVKYPYLDISFMTAHASKGLGYDNVIVINGKNETYGFPSKVEDDPVLSFVIKTDRSIDYAEERRLFYVAMTRTKNRVFFIAPEENPSEFLLEIKKDYKNVVLRGQWNEDSEKIPNYKKTCPICGFPMQLRYKQSIGLRLYLCTNEPEICDFMTNDYAAGKLGIMKCDQCQSGSLIVKSSKGEYFLGCTNYKQDKTGCSNIVTRSKYYEMMGITDEIPSPKITIPTAAKTVKKPITKSNDSDLNESSSDANKPAVLQMPALKDIIYKNIILNDAVYTVLQCLTDVSVSRYVSADVLTDILCGKEDSKIKANKFNQLALYGSCRHYSRDDISFIIRWLIKNKFILQTKGRNPVLHPTYSSNNLQESISLPKLKRLAKDLSSAETVLNKAVNLDCDNYRISKYVYETRSRLSISDIADKLNKTAVEPSDYEITADDICSWLQHEGIISFENDDTASGYKVTSIGAQSGFFIDNAKDADGNTFQILTCDLTGQKFIVLRNFSRFIDYIKENLLAD